MSALEGRPAELFALDRETCRALLGTQHVGRLVTTGADARIVPVNFVVDGDMVVFRRSAVSAATADVGGTALFEADMFDERTRSGWSVVVAGRLIARPPDLVPITLETWAPGDRDQCLAVTMDTLTGRLLRGEVEAPRRAADGYL